MKRETIKPLTVPTSSTPVSPWVTFLTGKKVPADRFLRDMEHGAITVSDQVTGKSKKTKTGRVIRPDESARNQFAEALTIGPEQVKRLLSMLQASSFASDTICRIVTDLTEVGIKRLGVVTLPDSLDAVAFEQSVSSWIEGFPRRPLKANDFNLLLLLIHFGWYRQLLDHDTALRLLDSAVRNPTLSKAARMAPTPLEVLLATPPTGPQFESLLAYFEGSKTVVDGLNAQIQSEKEQITRLSAINTQLKADINDLHHENAELQELKDAAERTKVQLEKQVVSIRADYQYKLDEQRGRIRGALQGQVTRWLQTSLDAVRASPPRTEAAEILLEEALNLIEKEMQWLRPSASTSGPPTA